MLSLGSGDPGCGKTSQHKFLCTVLPNAYYLCLEYKDVELLEGSGVKYKIIEQFDDNYMEDPVATLAMLEREIHDIIHSNKYNNIVIDGVSDIRTFAKKEWIHLDNLDRIRKQLKPRETISGENKGAWADINDRVKGILRPLINWASVTRNNVFFTAQLKDSYLNDKKVGKEINAGDWIEYDVDCKFEFKRNGIDQYVIRITKLPRWAENNGVYEITPVTLDAGFLGVLMERKLIKNAPKPQESAP